ncbi:hypothetical protein EJ110_NYTH46586 [Nymphaea thermarum]|nr:hypothetical protein EJ110_NYTH46586 [Nymphaea thermarum]
MAGRAWIVVLLLMLLFRQPVVLEARDLRPSMHGLPYQRQVAVVPPSTVSFFGNSSTIALPEGLDADGALGPPKGDAPSGSVPFFRARKRPVGDGRRAKILLVVAVVCGVVAVALLTAALCAVFCRTRSRK